MAEPATQEILELTATFFESRLHDSDAGQRVLARLARVGVGEDVLREFGVGYAPGDVRELLEHLTERGYSEAELVNAGIAKRSERDYAHVLFHARVMFPIRSAAGRLEGFAGLATHLGPSWPLWIASPDGPSYQAGSALFGIDRALTRIGDERRALIKRDCVEVLRLHQEGRKEAVAVLLSPVTAAHLAVLAKPMGIVPRELSVVRNRGLDAVVVQASGADVADDAFGSGDRPYGSVPIGATIRSDWEPGEEPDLPVGAEGSERPDGARIWVYLVGIAIGVGIPLGTLTVIAPDVEDGPAGATPALNAVITGVALSYLVLTIVVGRISAHHRDRSTSRRMRLPWARGSGEVQPSGWTYHRLEEVLIGAALVSALICLVLWMTIGGFLG